MRQTCVTTLRYLAATDTSGGVARQQKITHAYESPFYDNAQFPHPLAITYRGKKYSQILFGQTMYNSQRLSGFKGMPVYCGYLHPDKIHILKSIIYLSIKLNTKIVQ
jgi:hypothetical protein